jgi:hypothetical protein
MVSRSLRPALHSQPQGRAALADLDAPDLSVTLPHIYDAQTRTEILISAKTHCDH